VGFSVEAGSGRRSGVQAMEVGTGWCRGHEDVTAEASITTEALTMDDALAMEVGVRAVWRPWRRAWVGTKAGIVIEATEMDGAMAMEVGLGWSSSSEAMEVSIVVEAMPCWHEEGVVSGHGGRAAEA
jgi:hypothetical protein